MREVRHLVVKDESKFIGVDEDGFGEIDHYSTITFQTSFPVGTRVLVTITEDSTQEMNKTSE